MDMWDPNHEWKIVGDHDGRDRMTISEAKATNNDILINPEVLESLLNGIKALQQKYDGTFEKRLDDYIKSGEAYGSR